MENLTQTATTNPQQSPGVKDEPKMRLARAISVVLHPFFVPLYMVLTLLYTRTIFWYYTTPVKLYLIGATILFTMLLPFVVLNVLKRVGVLTSLSVTNRKERIMPLLAGAACYMLCSVMLMRSPSLFLLGKMMAGAACCELFVLMVTLRWKISLHLTAMGGAMGMLVMMSVAGAGGFTAPIIISTALCGVLATSRLYLGCHNGWQILAGFSSGFLIMVLSMLF